MELCAIPNLTCLATADLLTGANAEAEAKSRENTAVVVNFIADIGLGMFQSKNVRRKRGFLRNRS